MGFGEELHFGIRREILGVPITIVVEERQLSPAKRETARTTHPNLLSPSVLQVAPDNPNEADVTTPLDQETQAG